ncbi:MAG: cardiolipin synthase [Verrucomicrobiales bacterium]
MFQWYGKWKEWFFGWLGPANERVSDWLAAFAKRFPRTARFFGIVRKRRRPLAILLSVILHIVGFFFSIEAVMQTRTEQGTVAWAIALNTVPLVAVPGWLVFGDSEFGEYITTRRAGLEEVRPVAERLIGNLTEAETPAATEHPTMKVLEKLASIPAMKGNKAELLVDGKNTFKSIFDEIEIAENYILVQFYIVRADETGGKLKDLLIEKAKEGVRVYVLVDDVGSSKLPVEYFNEMREAGIEARYFMDFSEDANRFQLNFRNHRKIVVVDGKTGYLGGHNVGDEYLGMHPTLTPWRDSHMRLTGPVVKSIQIPFVEDWHWATGELLEDLEWEVGADGFTGGMEAICLASGPADPVETCSMFFLTAINNAKKRVWIATPYFVPDDKMVTAIQMAAIRGVDVRIIMPELVDSELVYLSSFSYLEEFGKTGAKLYRYQKGFMHQKVVLIDDEISCIGSANFDNRSFRLNFEVIGIVHDTGFNSEVAEMLEQDIADSRRVGAEDYVEKDFIFRLKVRLARLLAPIQ